MASRAPSRPFSNRRRRQHDPASPRDPKGQPRFVSVPLGLWGERASRPRTTPLARGQGRGRPPRRVLRQAPLDQSSLAPVAAPNKRARQGPPWGGVARTRCSNNPHPPARGTPRGLRGPEALVLEEQISDEPEEDGDGYKNVDRGPLVMIVKAVHCEDVLAVRVPQLRLGLDLVQDDPLDRPPSPCGSAGT